MRPSQPPDRIVRGFLCRLVTAWRRNDRFSPTALPLPLSRTRSKRSAAFAETSCQPAILRSRTCNRCGGQRPCSCSGFLLQRAESKERVGEEAATPGQPVALARVFWSVRRRFTLENRRLPLALPQSSGKLRNSHVSLNPLSDTLLRLATQKTNPLVQKLWTMRLPCGCRRKTKN
jgi:hypothetical protein